MNEKGIEIKRKHSFVKCLYEDYVVPNYARLDLVLTRGTGAYVWDDKGRRYLDMGGGIAVCSLGHSHPIMRQALSEQSGRLLHISNLYYHELQGQLAKQLVKLLAPGKCFFCNSGAEANEAMIKLARKVGNPNGRFEIITAQNSFHGRTMAGISASGQAKIKRGFEPLLPGFVHVPFGDLASVERAISPSTIAVMIEGIQGEGGIHCASKQFLFGLRSLCDQKGLLLLYDGVQCGHFRTGCFQSFQRILEDENADECFFPDAISMAKSLGGGFPIGAMWVNQQHCNVLKAGTHGTTFGGSPLASALALAVLDEVKKSKLDLNARKVGDAFSSELHNLQTEFPQVISAVRGLGLIIGVEFHQGFSNTLSPSPLSVQMARALQEKGMLSIPASTNVIRFLPPLNVSFEQAKEAVEMLRQTLKGLLK